LPNASMGEAIGQFAHVLQFELAHWRQQGRLG
jgi:hypothetical protein